MAHPISIASLDSVPMRSFFQPGVAALLALVLLPVFAQPANAEVTIEHMSNDRIFAIQFPGGLAFYGLVGRVSSISLQEYSSGPYVVTEMVVDLNGSTSQLRIYVTEPFDVVGAAHRATRSVRPSSGAPSPTPTTAPVEAVTNRARRAIDSLTDDIVVKDYPLATHSHTIEYRIAKRDTLIQLFEIFVHLWDGSGVEVVANGEATPLDRLNGVRFLVDLD